MELIDRNALKKAIGSYVVDDAKLSFNELYGNEDLLKVFDLVNAMPVVEAVPVSYIQQRIDRLRLLAEYEFEANGGYIGQVCFEYEALKQLIKDWKAEQSAKDK